MSKPDEPGGLSRAAAAASSGGLTGRTANGFSWMMFGSGGQIVLQVLVVAVLARLVSPADFGVVAASLVVITMLTIIADSGIGPALIQRADLSRDHIRVGFTCVVLLAAVLQVALVASTPWVASLMNVPELNEVMPVLSLVIPLRALTIGDFLLSRELAFRKLALIELVSYAIGYGVLGIALALADRGVWAIVGAQIGQAALRTAIMWVVHPHPLMPLLAKKPLRDLLGYGAGHMLAKAGHFIATQADNVVVSRYLGAAALGFYGRAYQFMTMPGVLFGQVVDRVLFPSMSIVQDDRERLSRAFLVGVGLVGALALPFTGIMAVLSTEVVLVLLGPEWLPTKAAFDILVYGMLFRTSYRLSDCLSRATGAVYRRAWRTGLFAGLVLLGSLVGQPFGLTGVAAGVLAALAINNLLMAHLSLRLTGLRWRAFFGAHTAGLVMALSAAGMTAAVTAPMRPVAPAAVTGLVGGLVGVVTCVLLLRVSSRLPGFTGLEIIADDLRRIVAHVPGGSKVLRLIGPPTGARGRAETEGSANPAAAEGPAVPRDAVMTEPPGVGAASDGGGSR